MKRLTLPQGKWVLIPGLLVALGFNLSWNPEQQHLARYERGQYHSVELAQQAPPAADSATRGALDVPPPAGHGQGQAQSDSNRSAEKGQQAATPPAAPAPAARPASPQQSRPVDPPTEQNVRNFTMDVQGGHRVEYSLSNSGDRVAYSIRSTQATADCTECQKVQYLTIDPGFANNMQLIRNAIAADVQKQLASNRTRSERRESESSSRTRTSCRMGRHSDKSDVMNCRVEEFQKILEECEKYADMNTREGDRKENQCKVRAQAYYNTQLKPLIREGLRSGLDSDLYQAAVDTRDQLMSEMPEFMKNKIADLTKLTTEGVIARAHAAEQQGRAQCDMAGMNQVPQQQFQQQPGLQQPQQFQQQRPNQVSICYSQATLGAHNLLMRERAQGRMGIYNSIMGSNLEESAKAGTFMQNYEHPLLGLIRQNPAQGINWERALEGVGLANPTLVQNGQGGGLTLPTTPFDARQQGQTAPQAPGLGTPGNNGFPAPSGPGALPGTGNAVMDSSSPSQLRTRSGRF